MGCKFIEENSWACVKKKNVHSWLECLSTWIALKFVGAGIRWSVCSSAHCDVCSAGEQTDVEEQTRTKAEEAASFCDLLSTGLHKFYQWTPSIGEGAAKMAVFHQRPKKRNEKKNKHLQTIGNGYLILNDNQFHLANIHTISGNIFFLTVYCNQAK